MKKVWGVYTQYEPTHKYEESLESLWSTKELALKEAEEHKDGMDHVWVQEIEIDSTFMYGEDWNFEKVK